MKKSFKLLGVLACMLSATAFAQQAKTLKEGNTAPPLAVAKWVKGTPVKGFEKGKVYVVEFWATWCGPCREAIPHVTEMAKKYKDKATFIGISVWEEKKDNKDTSYYKAVEAFVKDMGAKMNYNIAIDGPAGTISETWLKPANQNGIPTSFVIDQEGKIAWIGHPMMGLEEVVDQVVAKKFDVKKAAQMRAEAEKKEPEMQKIYEGLGKAFESGDADKVVAAYNDVVKKMPQLEVELGPSIYEALMDLDSAKAIEFGKTLMNGPVAKNAMALNQLAWTVVETDAFKVEDYKWACEVADKAAALTKYNDYMILDTLAYAYFRCGDKKMALEMQTKAVMLCEKDPKADPETKKELKARLETFKK
jgi:thiol-disulfide isomerase/thioredoxin